MEEIEVEKCAVIIITSANDIFSVRLPIRCIVESKTNILNKFIQYRWKV